MSVSASHEISSKTKRCLPGLSDLQSLLTYSCFYTMFALWWYDWELHCYLIKYHFWFHSFHISLWPSREKHLSVDLDQTQVLFLRKTATLSITPWLWSKLFRVIELYVLEVDSLISVMPLDRYAIPISGTLPIPDTSILCWSKIGFLSVRTFISCAFKANMKKGAAT